LEAPAHVQDEAIPARGEDAAASSANCLSRRGGADLPPTHESWPGAVTRYAPNQPIKTRHRIVTSIAPSCPLLGAVLAAHSATAVVGCVDIPGYATVWNTMFGSP